MDNRDYGEERIAQESACERDRLRELNKGSIRELVRE